MERYKCFKNSRDYQSFFESLNPMKIGEGSEGQAFLFSGDKVIKIFNGPSKPNVADEEKETIIMAQDYSVQTFLLPIQLHIYDNKVVGYVSNFFPNNILGFKAPYNGNIFQINFSNLLKAREKMIRDTILLSDNNIAICDLDFNLLFDNRKLVAIDTFDYSIDSNVTLEDNIKQLDRAILRELHYHDISFKPDYKESVEYNLKRVK